MSTRVVLNSVTVVGLLLFILFSDFLRESVSIGADADSDNAFTTAVADPQCTEIRVMTDTERGDT